jgi:hypothetical protein
VRSRRDRADTCVLCEHGWLRAPIPIGTSVRTAVLALAAIGAMTLLGWYVMPTIGTGPDTRAYLTTEFVGAGLDSKADGTVFIRVLTTNIGKLQSLPLPATRMIFAYPRIRKILTPDEEEELFNTQHVGGGPGVAIFPDKTYWDPGHSQITDLEAQVEFDNPADYQAERDALTNARKVVYVLARHIYTDNLGLMVTENCFYLTAPSFAMPVRCYGFNGPRKSRPLLGLGPLGTPVP